MKDISIAVIGCGDRAIIYTTLMKELEGEKIRISAVVDPIKERRNIIAKLEDNGNVAEYDSYEDFFMDDKNADAVIIATQDKDHFKPALKALKQGYDLILEKPISVTLGEVLELNDTAVALGRRVIICHVLRYTPFYNKIKEIIDSGQLGDIVSLNATEGVGTWHNVHAFVRGKWADTKESSPMIVAKSCHDMDIISWLINEPCLNISSFGELTYFREENAPSGSPERCIDGCPVSDHCMYNAMQYMNKYRDIWLSKVFDAEKIKLSSGGAERYEIVEWLKTSPWGRCVFRCDNDAVDHQVVSMRFRKGKTATFTMTAFDRERNIEVFGTKGVLKGGSYTKEISGHDLVFYNHENEEAAYWNISFNDAGNQFHGGGDYGFAGTLYNALTTAVPSSISSSIQNSVESHVMAFAAEESRLTGETIKLDEYIAKVRGTLPDNTGERP